MNCRIQYIFFIYFFFITKSLSSQTDTIKQHKLQESEKNKSALLKNYRDTQNTEGFKFTAYIDAYLAHYTDNLPVGSYQKFPTSAPISNNFGLNMAMLSVRYKSAQLRGIITLHTGDIPSSSWSSSFNIIQEANMGVKLLNNLWLDAGFFRTHLGVESIQPRENSASSMSLTNYYEPYYLSGVKLTYYASKKLSMQLNAFNGFNTFVPINNKKAYGLSIVFAPNSKLTATFNTLLSDNSPDSLNYNQPRLYQNNFLSYQSKFWDIHFELNFGVQKNTGISDSTATANIFSTLISAKYKIKNGKYAVYSRAEKYNDKNEILTGPVINANHALVGVNAFTGTLGLEFKPVKNSYIRFESRFIHLWNNQNIFYTKQQYTNIRMEFIATMGVWF